MAAMKTMAFQPVSFQPAVNTTRLRKYSLLTKKLTGSPPNHWMMLLTSPPDVERIVTNKPEIMTQDRKCGR
ncbi:hypothetical protein D3C78_1927330 [compost metagenome]